MTTDLAEDLANHGQRRLAAYLASVTPAVRARLAAQLAGIDLGLMRRLITDPAAVCEIDAAAAPEVIGAVADADTGSLLAEARERGEEHLRAGQVAVVLLAGGQGSRLGFSGPKGAFAYAPITGHSLFWQHAATIAALRTRYRCALPWYILTSPANDRETREFFARHDHFGLGPASIRFVVQGTLPVVDAATGDFLLRAPGALALAPDGHGGVIGALGRSGALAEMAAEGIASVFTFQVDNPLTAIARPELVGLRLLRGADIASVAVRKLTPDEPIGTFVVVDGRTRIVEYSDLPAGLVEAREADGSSHFWAGSINVHCIARTLLEDVVIRHLSLPYHRAIKAVPHMGYDGTPVAPTVPNAVKFETFLFDVLMIARNGIVVHVDRAEEFSPIKNAEGTDSPMTCRRDMNRRNARWLESAGVRVARGADGEPRHDIEIDPRRALDPDELAKRLPAGLVIDRATMIDAPHVPTP